MSYKEEFEQKLNNGEFATDSQIEDFIDEKQEECTSQAGKNAFACEMWETYYQWRAKGTKCEGCRNAGCWGMFPCSECSRKVVIADHYSKARG